MIRVVIFISAWITEMKVDIPSLHQISHWTPIVSYLQIGQYWHQVCLDQLIFYQCSRYRVLTVKEIKNALHSSLVYKSDSDTVGEVCIQAKWPIRPELIPVSVAWSNWEYFYSPLDGMLVHRRVTPSIKFADIHLYT